MRDRALVRVVEFRRHARMGFREFIAIERELQRERGFRQ